ncbi:kinesin like protein for actin based chloroplast movement 1 [Striga asiatica]|uniref:Kinesin like protein for actin based chloroplast movement 1 n=1 Tax=Striga asiatica TaxID=4170 RepID=A0A5A7Q079_STRAF|nr:kinesin like protein for actin based chloroplast movement 1 [Striga asiatica]
MEQLEANSKAGANREGLPTTLIVARGSGLGLEAVPTSTSAAAEEERRRARALSRRQRRILKSLSEILGAGGDHRRDTPDALWRLPLYIVKWLLIKARQLRKHGILVFQHGIHERLRARRPFKKTDIFILDGSTFSLPLDIFVNFQKCPSVLLSVRFLAREGFLEKKITPTKARITFALFRGIVFGFCVVRSLGDKIHSLKLGVEIDRR